MRILYLDIDTTRADHLSCYGYHRNTTPNIDAIAREGVMLQNCYASDVPCLPSRAAMFRNQLGIISGVVNHGGVAAEPKNEGAMRPFQQFFWRNSWIYNLVSRAGLHTVSVSPFGERHSAWWFYAGFREMYNTGKRGQEIADEVVPTALDWIERNGDKDDWFLHVNLWDPHRSYRVPMEFGNPFENDPPPDWLTDELIALHRQGFGPRSAQEPHAWSDPSPARVTPREPMQIKTQADFKKWIDGYDVGIRYADRACGMLLDALEKKGVMDDLVVIVTSDHGEQQGELNVYGDHHGADEITCRIPFVIRWPGVLPAGWVDPGLYYQLDAGASITGLLGGTLPETWDGRDFSENLKKGKPGGRDHLVLSMLVWSCQRSVRWGDHIYLRTYHDGYHNWPAQMLFNLKDDPHETTSLVENEPELVRDAQAMLNNWTEDCLSRSIDGIDPLQIVLREGGAYHTRGALPQYLKRLEATGRSDAAQKLREIHPGDLKLLDPEA